jgi:predicted alpha/beta superfamily hydrolase
MTETAPHAIPGVESFLIRPEGLDVGLRVSIGGPARPAFGAAARGRLPVFYVTDADYCFGTVLETARMAGYAGEAAPAVVVGIGYADEPGDYSFNGIRRATDFYSGPKRSFEVPGYAATLGGADDFLAGLIDHVFPEVERREPRIDPARRFLFGASAGGHFAAYALAKAPQAFAGYAMISPNLRDWPPVPGEEVMLDLVAAMPRGAIPPGVRVFFSAGELEEEPGEPLAAAGIITNIHRMRTVLAGLGVETRLAVFPGETHISVGAAAISRAVRCLAPPTGEANWQVATASNAEDSR